MMTEHAEKTWISELLFYWSRLQRGVGVCELDIGWKVVVLLPFLHVMGKP
jgi:hypothetical protein